MEGLAEVDVDGMHLPINVGKLLAPWVEATIEGHSEDVFIVGRLSYVSEAEYLAMAKGERGH